MTRRLRKFLELTPEDRLLLLTLWCLLPFVAALLRLLDYPQTLRLLSRWLPAGAGPQQRADKLTLLARCPGAFPPPGQGGGQEGGRNSPSETMPAMCHSLRSATHRFRCPTDPRATEAQGAADRIGPANAVPEAAMSYALRLGRLARIAGRYVPTNGSCLRQSLLVWWLLRRKGVPAELCIGVRKQEGLAAHAWVEVAGQPVNDAPDVAERFAPFHGSIAAVSVTASISSIRGAALRP